MVIEFLKPHCNRKIGEVVTYPVDEYANTLIAKGVAKEVEKKVIKAKKA
jgi:hypothetical protein